MFDIDKPAIARNTGAFSEYPDEIMRKVRYDKHEVDDVCEAMLHLANEKNQFSQLAQ